MQKGSRKIVAMSELSGDINDTGSPGGDTVGQETKQKGLLEIGLPVGVVQSDTEKVSGLA